MPRPGTIPLFGTGFYLYDPQNPPDQIEERMAHAELLRQQAADMQAKRQAARDALLQWQGAAGRLLDPVTVPGTPARDENFTVPSAPTNTGAVQPGSVGPEGFVAQPLKPLEDTGVGTVSMAVPEGQPTSRPPTSTEVAGRTAQYMTPNEAAKQITESMDKDAAIAAGQYRQKQAAIPKTIPEILAWMTQDPAARTAQGRAQIVDLIREEANAAGAKKKAEFIPNVHGAGTPNPLIQTEPNVFMPQPNLGVPHVPPQPTAVTVELDNAKYLIGLEKGEQYTPSTEEVAAKAVSLKSRSEYKSLIPIISAARDAEARGDTKQATNLRGLVKESITALSQVAGANTAAQQASIANAPVAAHGTLAQRILMPDGSAVDSNLSLPQLEARGAIAFPTAAMMDAFHQGLLFERQMPEVLAAAKKFFGKDAVARREPPGFFRGMRESLGTYLKTTKVGQGLSPDASSFIGQVKSLGLKLARVDNGGRPTEPDYDKAAGVLFGDWDTYESFVARVANGQRIAKDSMTNMRKQAVKPTVATPVGLPGGGSYAPVTE